MQWLGRRRDAQRGSVSVIVAILFSTGVLLGCAALTVDVGNISAERRQLQNGSDAVALSAARDCAQNGICPAVANVDPNHLADANAADGATKIARVDGTAPVCGQGPGLATCPPVSGGLGDCVTPASGMPKQYVRVYAQTETKDGSTILPYFFGQALVGGKGVTQQTCSTAAWGPAGSAKVLPLTLPKCFFDKITTKYPLGSTYTVAIAIADDAETCDSTQVAPPGGKGWLDGGGDCLVTSTVGGSNTGAGKANSYTCLPSLLGEVAFVPLYDTASNSGTNGQYHIWGLAAFHIVGYMFPSVTANGQTASPACPSTDFNLDPKAKGTGNSCIWGYFTTEVAPVGSISPTAPNTGLNIVQMIG